MTSATGYDDLLVWLHGQTNYERLGIPGSAAAALDPTRCRDLLARLGDPQDGLRVVHIAGSKGKGTTAALLEAIVAAAGRSTGLFTSPHLVDLRERIRIDVAPVRAAELAAAAFEEVIPTATALGEAGRMPTFFEVLTALGLVVFRRRAVDLAILEVGLGGRLDATNVVARPVATAITLIDLEHTQILGEDLATIAREKAGIVKPGVPIATLETDAAARGPIDAAAVAAGVPIVGPGVGGLQASVTSVSLEGTRLAVSTPLGRRDGLELRLVGRHHADDAALAIHLAETVAPALGLDPSSPAFDAAVRAGLKDVRWPARFDPRTPEGAPAPWIVDTAHTRRSAAALAATFAEVLPGRRAVLVVGIAADKDLAAVAAALAPIAAAVIATRTDGPRARAPADVGAAFEAAGKGRAAALVSVTENVDAAIAAAEAWQREHADPVVVTGSVYLAGDVIRRMFPGAVGELG